MDKEMQSRIQLGNFIESNANSFKERPNGDLTGQARVLFRTNSSQVQETLNMIIHRTTWEADKISLEDGDIITAKDYHVEFTPRYQAYECTADNFLLITSHSPKLGPYEVRIIPV